MRAVILTDCEESLARTTIMKLEARDIQVLETFFGFGTDHQTTLPVKLVQAVIILTSNLHHPLEVDPAMERRLATGKARLFTISPVSSTWPNDMRGHPEIAAALFQHVARQQSTGGQKPMRAIFATDISTQPALSHLVRKLTDKNITILRSHVGIPLGRLSVINEDGNALILLYEHSETNECDVQRLKKECGDKNMAFFNLRTRQASHWPNHMGGSDLEDRSPLVNNLGQEDLIPFLRAFMDLTEQGLSRKEMLHALRQFWKDPSPLESTGQLNGALHRIKNSPQVPEFYLEWLNNRPEKTYTPAVEPHTNGVSHENHDRSLQALSEAVTDQNDLQELVRLYDVENKELKEVVKREAEENAKLKSTLHETEAKLTEAKLTEAKLTEAKEAHKRTFVDAGTAREKHVRDLASVVTRTKQECEDLQNALASAMADIKNLTASRNMEAGKTQKKLGALELEYRSQLAEERKLVAVWVAKHKTLELESQTRTAEGNKVILAWKQKCDALEAERLKLKEAYEALRSQPQPAPTPVTPAGAEKFKTAIKNVKQMVEIGLMTAEEAWQKLEAFDPK